MRILSIFLLLLFCTDTFAQTEYISDAAQYRAQKHENLKNDPFGPLRSDQVDMLRYYEVDPTFVIPADVEILFGQRKFRMPTYDGSSTEYIRFAKLKFKVNEQIHGLTAYKNIGLLQNPKYKDYLFVPFLDQTNGNDTYEGGRYVELSAAAIKDGRIIIDFNKAYNPYCAYSNGYRCPVPPVENHLKTAIFAGEKKYLGPKNERLVNKKSAQKFEDAEREIILAGEATAPMHVYQITNEAELAVLKAVSTDIDPTDPLVEVLAQRMLATVQNPEHAGVGIAAPQVGINKNMIWVQRYDKTDFPFELYINPKIIWRSKLLRKGGEGCLSIPEQRNDVQRNYSIRLQYWTKEGEIKEELIEGFTAVIFQHEVDHLYGILFPDRVEEQAEKEIIPLTEKPTFSVEQGTFLP